MALYMIESAFTPEAWAKMAQKPEDRRESVRPMAEKAGCKLREMYFAFGKYDVVLILEAPDAVTAASVAVAAISAGHLRTLRTTPLLTVEDAMSAMQKAGGLKLRTPLSG